MTTVSHEADWSGVLPTKAASHRNITSSRHPGREFTGVVYHETQTQTLTVCPDCGGWRQQSLHPHAPRWRDGKLVDCAGREVRP